MTERLLSRIADILQRNLPRHSLATTIPRGDVIPVDTTLRGTLRFARAVGNTFPFIVPNNTMTTAVDALSGSTEVTVKRTLTFPVGSIVSFNRLEHHVVVDVQGDRIQLDYGTLSRHVAGTLLALHSVPVLVHADYTPGSTLELDSDFPIVIGDSIEVVSDVSIPSSGTAYTVTGAEALDADVTAYSYRLTLADPISQTTLIAGDTVYLRAYPAYVSELQNLPTQAGPFSKGNVGPFLWDVLYGRLHDGVNDVKPVLALRTVSSSFRLGSVEFERTELNTPHWHTDVPSSAFLFWNVLLGTLSVRNRHACITPTVDSPDFMLTWECVPRLSTPEKWKMSFKSAHAGHVRVNFHLETPPVVPPSAPLGHTYTEALQLFSLEVELIPGSVVTGEVELPAGYTFDRIEIAGTADGPVELRDWYHQSTRSSWVQYTLMAPVDGVYSYGMTGIMVKPLFYTADHLNRAQVLDSGTVTL